MIGIIDLDPISLSFESHHGHRKGSGQRSRQRRVECWKGLDEQLGNGIVVDVNGCIYNIVYLYIIYYNIMKHYVTMVFEPL